jgi:hypothetical protein
MPARTFTLQVASIRTRFEGPEAEISNPGGLLRNPRCVGDDPVQGPSQKFALVELTPSGHEYDEGGPCRASLLVPAAELNGIGYGGQVRVTIEPL